MNKKTSSGISTPAQYLVSYIRMDGHVFPRVRVRRASLSWKNMNSHTNHINKKVFPGYLFPSRILSLPHSGMARQVSSGQNLSSKILIPTHSGMDGKVFPDRCSMGIFCPLKYSVSYTVEWTITSFSWRSSLGRSSLSICSPVK